ncbi:hypothetical protein, conserved in T. vivax [Trypanosoma vivax Y486]|uniref:Uncharacterized protein n=1 Tax=Trypanosoma vivax (strain Y486) TaxID=1055687 RepID=F9WQI0_TRYVY|nr:hypothetical protein, conserved in T. vivax [Trypanosoma vivax Y486]|eukprot:CCD19808.1 hypothetical protein, conserved in T. vivax [Trypanosoma vivax Y486]
MVHWSALRGSSAVVRLPRCARLAARGAFPVPSLSLMTSRRAAQGASAYRARASTCSQRAWTPHAGSFAAEDKDAGERRLLARGKGSANVAGHSRRALSRALCGYSGDRVRARCGAAGNGAHDAEDKRREDLRHVKQNETARGAPGAGGAHEGGCSNDTAGTRGSIAGRRRDRGEGSGARRRGAERSRGSGRSGSRDHGDVPQGASGARATNTPGRTNRRVDAATGHVQRRTIRPVQRAVHLDRRWTEQHGRRSR